MVPSPTIHTALRGNAQQTKRPTKTNPLIPYAPYPFFPTKPTDEPAWPHRG